MACSMRTGQNEQLPKLNLSGKTPHERLRSPTYPTRGGAKDMDLAEAECAALSARPKTSRTGLGVANVGQSRDPVTEWEERVAAQFKALQRFAKSSGSDLTEADMPSVLRGSTPGREITAYLGVDRVRVWKATFPGEAGFGQFGYYTPAGYLRRLRLSNRIFGG